MNIFAYFPPLPADNKQRVSLFFKWTYLFVTFAMFLCPSYTTFLVIFYVGLLPATLLWFWFFRPDWLAHPTLIAVYIFMFYSTATLIFNIDEDRRWCLKLLGKTAITLFFLFSSVAFFSGAQWRKYYIRFTAYAAMTGAVLSIGYFLFHADIRLSPIAVAHHPILGGSIYGLFGLFSLYAMLEEKIFLRKLFYAFTSFVIFILVVLTQSKGPIVAVFFSYMLLIFLFLTPPSRIRCFLTGLAVLAGLYFLCEQMHIWSHVEQLPYMVNLEQRGLSYRPQIWDHAWSELSKRPILGYGLGKAFSFEVVPGVTIWHPHNFFLSTLYYTGIVGFALLSIMIGFIGRDIQTSRDCRWKKLAIVLMIYIFLSLISDVVRLESGPKELLFIFWLPVSMMIAEAIRTKSEVV